MGTLITAVTIGQEKQVKRFAEDAVDRVIAEGLLNKGDMQRLIEKGDKFQDRVIDVIKELSATQFADEETESNYTYPKGYNAHPTLEENLQDLEKELKILRASFPELNDSDYDRQFINRIRTGDVVLPEGAERWTLIPLWGKIAPYGKVVTKVIAMVGYDYIEHTYLYRRQARTERMLRTLHEQQHNNYILVVPVQFGLRHRGRSVRRAREVFADNEFGLGTFEVGIMLLTHPEREVQWAQLHIHCAGDELNPLEGSRFMSTPGVDWDDDDDHIIFVGYFFGEERYGSASAFLSQ